MTGQVRPGRISRETLRRWLERFAGRDDVTFAVEGCTGWQFVVEELQRAGITALLAEPAETAHLRGPKRRAKTDKTDARHLRMLVADGRVPLSWIPPRQVCEVRALLQLYRDLAEEHTAWTQRIHATLFHQGVPGLADSSATRGCAPGWPPTAPGWACRPLGRRRSRCAGWTAWRPSSARCRPVYQALRIAMTAAAESAGADPDRASFTIALEAARDQVTAARGVADSADPGDTGRIGRAVLADLLPARRPRCSTRKVKCSTSRYHVRDQDRPCQSVTITRVQITIVVPPPDRPPAPAARTSRPSPDPASPARTPEEIG